MVKILEKEELRKKKDGRKDGCMNAITHSDSSQYLNAPSIFKWRHAYQMLDWLDDSYLNISHEAIDKHMHGDRKDQNALVWKSLSGRTRTFTFTQLKVLTDKFANVLKSLGIQKGEVILISLGDVPELYVSFYGILKVGAIVGILPSDMGLEVVKWHMKKTGAKVLITTLEFRFRFQEIIPELFELQHIIIVDTDNTGLFYMDPSDLSFDNEMGKASSQFDIVRTIQNDEAIIIFSKDSSGYPRGLLYRHQSVAELMIMGNWVLDLYCGDKYWSMLDNHSFAGIGYGIISPLVNGATVFIDQNEYTALQCYGKIQSDEISIWCITPTIIRVLMENKEEFSLDSTAFKNLRVVANIGTQLSREALLWGREVLGVCIHNGWGFYESGGLICSNYRCDDIRPDSIGLPFPGIELEVMDDNCNPVRPGTIGSLAIWPEYPSMVSGYWQDMEAYRDMFVNGWYVTKYYVRVDTDGYFRYCGER